MNEMFPKLLNKLYVCLFGVSRTIPKVK